MVLFSCFYSEAILKISQIEGLRDPGWGVPLSPLALLREAKSPSIVIGLLRYIRVS